MFAAMTRENYSSSCLPTCIYTYTHCHITCDKAVLYPCNCSSEAPMNTARRRRQAGRHQGGAGTAWLAAQAAQSFTLHQLSWPYTRRIRLSAISGRVACRSISLYISTQDFFQLLLWAGTGLRRRFGDPGLCSCSSPVCRLEEVHSRRMDATGREIFEGD